MDMLWATDSVRCLACRAGLWRQERKIRLCPLSGKGLGTQRECELIVFRWGHCDCWPSACFWYTSVSEFIGILGILEEFIYLQNYGIMHPVQVVSKIILSFHCSPGLCSARWGVGMGVRAKAKEKIDQDLYFLERSFLFSLLVCFQRISCWGGELGKCSEQSFSRNKQSIWKARSPVCWW